MAAEFFGIQLPPSPRRPTISASRATSGPGSGRQKFQAMPVERSRHLEAAENFSTKHPRTFSDSLKELLRREGWGSGAGAAWRSCTGCPDSRPAGSASAWTTTEPAIEILWRVSVTSSLARFRTWKYWASIFFYSLPCPKAEVSLLRLYTKGLDMVLLLLSK